MGLFVRYLVPIELGGIPGHRVRARYAFLELFMRYLVP